MPFPVMIGVVAAAFEENAGGRTAGDVKQKKRYKNQDPCDEAKLFFNLNETLNHIGYWEFFTIWHLQNYPPVFEEIRNDPAFSKYTIDGSSLPEYDINELNLLSAGAERYFKIAEDPVTEFNIDYMLDGRTIELAMLWGDASTLSEMSVSYYGVSAFKEWERRFRIGNAELVIGIGRAEIIIDGVPFTLSGVGDSFDFYASKADSFKEVAEMIRVNKELYHYASLFSDSVHLLERTTKQNCYPDETSKESAEEMLLVVDAVYRMGQLKLLVKQGSGYVVNKGEIEAFNDDISALKDKLSTL